MKTAVMLGLEGHWSVAVDEMEADGGFRVAGISAPGYGEGISKAKARFSCVRDAVVDDDPRRLLETVRPDFAVVSARMDQIPVLATMAAEAGCPFLTEKPLALDLGALRALWDTAVRHGVRCMPLVTNRQTPVLAAAVASGRRGDIGRGVLANARKSYRWGVRAPWFADRALYGGTIPWIGFHALDFIEAVSGSTPASVSAAHAGLGHPGFERCEDVCALTMTLKSGALATASLDYFRPATAPTHGDDWIRVVGTEGILEAEIARGHCRLWNAEHNGDDLPLPPETPTFGEWFRDLPPKGEGMEPDEAMKDAFRLTQAALCAREAADTGRVIAVPDAPWA